MSITEDKLQRIRDLERRHVEVYYQLLQTLDELYLVKESRRDIKLTPAELDMLELRNQMRFSMDKSVALYKTYDRLNKLMENNQDLSTVQSSEDKLAVNLKMELDRSVTIDGKVEETLQDNISLTNELQSETAKYNELTKKLQEYRPGTERRMKPTLNNIDSLDTMDQDSQINNENETIKQLLIALKVHTKTDI
ncbi:hypothetical protein C6P45_002002 [Maudiozyma exigua]|uniref:Uncharacterized protein n=1 Tax=Maudiozyma exigua TaxID=34358 RepID=A0A9P6WF35_MAUEX|nr:hypothetical protein C6P45_002002 [Kazachstania exigua]